MKLIDKETSMFGWGRIMASLAALVSFGAIVIGQPDAAPGTDALATGGTEVIDAAYILYAKIGALVSAVLAFWSKIRPLMPWIK